MGGWPRRCEDARSAHRKMKGVWMAGATACECLEFWATLMPSVLFLFFVFNLERMRQSRVAVRETSIWLRETGSPSHADILCEKEWRAQCDACWEIDRQVRLKNEMDWWEDRRIMIQSGSRMRRLFLLYQTKAGRMHRRECCCSCVCVHKSCHCVFVIMSLRTCVS